MTRSNIEINRRHFMVGAAGLTFGIVNGLPLDMAEAADDKTFSPWVTISTDDTVAIMSPAAEMGQGSLTSLPLILAEELDADWEQVRIVPAPFIEAIYGNPAFGGVMFTAGSTGVTAYFNELRIFGAQVRRVLLDNAVEAWGVAVEELTTEPNVVLHKRSGRRLTYGEIARFATIPASAPEIRPEQLKKSSEFRLIGKDVMRVELPGKVNGGVTYSIDFQIPGMIYGAVVKSPVEGGSPNQFDESKVKAIAGVIAAVRLPDGVGVLAETPWAAFDGKASIEQTISWNRTGKAWGF
jgi:isoquinoline 1-oxidoreductase beta subunit